MYQHFCRHAYLPAIDLSRRIPYARAYREACANQALSRDALHSLQVRRLRSLLVHASKYSPYYSQLFRECDFQPESITSIADLRSLPILEKQHVREFADGITSNSFNGTKFNAATSGSTGLSLRFAFDSIHAAWVEACVWRGRSWWNLRRGDRQALLLGHAVGASTDADRKVRLKYRLRNCIEFDSFRELTPERAGYLLEAIRQWRPRLVYGYGSSIGRLAVALETLGAMLVSGPSLVEFTADHIFENERLLAEKIFGAPVVPAYGARECGGMAQTCSMGNLHWSSDHAVCEVLRSDESAAEPGKIGDLVVTPLHNFAMPFLRYRIGDRISVSDKPCPCGVTLPTITLYAGRTSEMITTSEKQAVSSVVFDFINRIDLVKAGIRGIRQFLVEQTGRDSFELHVVRDEPFNPRSVEVFVERMRLALGTNIHVQVKFKSEIPIQPNGKRLFFKNAFSDADTVVQN